METPRPLHLLYQRPALAFLVATVAAGVWLRIALLYPAAKLDLPFRFMVHAHSHLAFYGWVTIMLFAALLQCVRPQATSFFRAHALLLALASAAAFFAFLFGGYGVAAIGLSAVAVGLWVALALRLWRDAAGHHFWRAALVFLGVSGLATFAPMAVLLRGAADAWWAELAIKLFLVPFINGWITLGVMGAVAGALDYRGGRVARWLVAAGAIPSTLLFVAAPPPAPALLIVGRAATALVATGGLAFAIGLWRARGCPNGWLAIGLAALAGRGALELLAAAGVAPALMRHPQVVVAYLHLVLLGFVTALLVGAALHRAGARARVGAALFGTGTALMLAAILANAWAALFLLLARAGLDMLTLLRLALLGGGLAAVGATLAALALLRAPAPTTLPRTALATSPQSD